MQCGRLAKVVSPTDAKDGTTSKHNALQCLWRNLGRCLAAKCSPRRGCHEHMSYHVHHIVSNFDVVKSIPSALAGHVLQLHRAEP